MNNQQIFLSLRNDIIGIAGQIIFNMGEISISIEEKDIVGSCIQSWLKQWFIQNNIPFATRLNTQEFPDYIINPNTSEEKLLEIKAWDYDNNPAFDIANFQSYCASLILNPNRLDADYLIFGYRMIGQNIEIVDIYLKKIWEISGQSKTYPVKVQVKRGIIYNLRPISFHRLSMRGYPPFNTRNDFVNALNQTLLLYPHTAPNSVNWLNIVQMNYLAQTGQQV